MQWDVRARRIVWAAVWLAGMAALLPPSAFARYEPRPCKNSFSSEQEIAEGAKAKQQVFKSYARSA